MPVAQIDGWYIFICLSLSFASPVGLPRTWTEAKDECTGRTILVTAHTEDKLQRVIQAGRENATKMNVRSSS
jgi:hypothetical protein